jgi:hypothetical protein
VEAAAAFVGCDMATIYNWENEGRLVPECNYSRNGRGPIKTYRRSALEPLKAARDADNGDGTFADAAGLLMQVDVAAERFGVPACRIRSKLEVLRRRPKLNSRDVDVVREVGVAALKAEQHRVAKRRAPKGHSDAAALAELVGARTPAARCELGECLALWREIGLLAAEKVPQLRKNRRGAGAALRDKWFYDADQFLRLWRADYLKPGLQALTRLIREGHNSAKEVVKEMRQVGITERRLYKVAKAAGAVCRLTQGLGSPWVYEFASRREPGAASGEELPQATVAPPNAARGGTGNATADDVSPRRQGGGPTALRALSETEQEIVRVVRGAGEPIVGETIAGRAGFPFNSYIRGLLSGLVKRGVLRKALGGGYLL